MKTPEQAMTEWAADEIHFSLFGRSKFNRRQFGLIIIKIKQFHSQRESSQINHHMLQMFDRLATLAHPYDQYYQLNNFYTALGKILAGVKAVQYENIDEIEAALKAELSK